MKLPLRTWAMIGAASAMVACTSVPVESDGAGVTPNAAPVPHPSALPTVRSSKTPTPSKPTGGAIIMPTVKLDYAAGTAKLTSTGTIETPPQPPPAPVDAGK